MNFVPKPKRTKAAHDWLDYLRDSEGLGGILAKTENLAKLKLALKAALVELDLDNFASKIEVGWRNGSQNELFLLVGGANVATRLQQVLPSLINELAKNGVVCTTIKVRLKPPPPAWDIKPREGREATQKAKGFNVVAWASWESLVDKLAPDSDLRKAVERLLQNKPK
jgi:hypothetical protein